MNPSLRLKKKYGTVKLSQNAASLTTRFGITGAPPGVGVRTVPLRMKKSGVRMPGGCNEKEMLLSSGPSPFPLVETVKLRPREAWRQISQ